MAVIPFNDTGKFSTQTSGIAVSTGTFDQVDLLRIPDVDPMFHMLNDGSSMFYRILSMLAKEEAATQPRFEFHEDDLYPIRTTVPTETSAVATTVVLADALAFKNSILYVHDTGEALFVSANSGTSCTVVRGHQGTTAAIIPADALIICIGATLPEGADANGGIAILPTKNWNAVSFYSQGCNSTDIQDLTNMLNGTATSSNEFTKQTLNLMQQMDQGLRYSSRNIDTSTSADGTIYSTGGFKDSVSTNILTHTGALTWDDFNELFAPAFVPTSSSNTKQLICGPTLFSQITKVSADHYFDGGTPQMDNIIGGTVAGIMLDDGSMIQLIRDKHGFQFGSGQAGEGFLIDMANIGIKPFNNFDLTWREVSDPKSHTKKFELYGSTGMKLTQEETHATFQWTAGT